MKVSEEKQQVQLTVFTTQPSNVASRHQLSAERERRDATLKHAGPAIARVQLWEENWQLSAVDRGKVVIILLYWRIEVHYYLQHFFPWITVSWTTWPTAVIAYLSVVERTFTGLQIRGLFEVLLKTNIGCCDIGTSSSYYCITCYTDLSFKTVEIFFLYVFVRH